MSEAGTPNDRNTLTAVLDELAGAGYTATFFVEEGGRLSCGQCGGTDPVERYELTDLRRLEGASDPGDMAAVAALGCPRCSARGSTVLRFGPEAGAADAQVLRKIATMRRSR